MISSILILSKLDHPKPNVLDMYYLGSLPGITLEYHLNSLMYQQHTSPVLIWSNLFLDLFETLRFHVSLKSNYSKLTFLLMYLTNTIPMILNGEH